MTQRQLDSSDVPSDGSLLKDNEDDPRVMNISREYLLGLEKGQPADRVEWNWEEEKEWRMRKGFDNFFRRQLEASEKGS